MRTMNDTSRNLYIRKLEITAIPSYPRFFWRLLILFGHISYMYTLMGFPWAILLVSV